MLVPRSCRSHNRVVSINTVHDLKIRYISKCFRFRIKRMYVQRLAVESISLTCIGRLILPTSIVICNLYFLYTIWTLHQRDRFACTSSDIGTLRDFIFHGTAHKVHKVAFRCCFNTCTASLLLRPKLPKNITVWEIRNHDVMLSASYVHSHIDYPPRTYWILVTHTIYAKYAVSSPAGLWIQSHWIVQMMRV